jgi:isoleucyl-tRNA synthetase
MPDNRPNFPKIEEDVLSFWDHERIFQKTLEKPSPRGRFVFFEGPPTANGRPGIHHIESRAFKDIVLRFRTMQGYLVERKAGWDTHGLPVELEVEKELGFTGKKDIEAFGIANFNKKCKESVWKYLVDWNEITRRIGFWLDLEHPYVTYEPAYVESLWWVMKQIWDKGLLYQDYKVIPYCPRCGTGLSSHELAQGYKEVEDPAVYVKFKVVKGTDGTLLRSFGASEGLTEGTTGTGNAYLVAWTTTPWTLPSNVALAVGSDIAYVKVKQGEEYLWVAKDRVEEATSGDYDVVEERTGEHLVGMEYEPLFPFVRDAIKGTDQETKRGWYVVPADFVTTHEGSGIVHTAVMYGQDDFELGSKIGLPKYHLVGFDGRFTEKAGTLAGKFVKDADAEITEDLALRGLLLNRETVRHTYPFCWRCKSPLIYYAKDSWYIRMSALRNDLITQNRNINWEPAHIKEGRFGEWLREVKDWAFSRERYWGTPLPIWVCQECGEKTCIGSFQELKDRSFSVLSDPFDPHRPFVDEIDLKCGKCGGASKRVPDVCDVWFDSGAMPFAQWHYPFENKERIDNGTAYPADYIAEAIDQTRGWFYTLLAVSTLLGKERSYKHVICLGHVLDAKGKKMSKSIGNVVNPIETVNRYGADAVRWYMYTINQPGESKRFDFKALDEMVKKVFMILWNVVTFYELYATNAVMARSEATKQSPVHILDRWILARLHQLIKVNTELLENYKITEPARNIAEFINDLSTWYVRRSRERFKGSDGTEGTRDAVVTLRACLLMLAKLMAPFTPFLSDALYLRLGGGKESVHLEDWPAADEAFMRETSLRQMTQIRSVASMALEKRASAGIPVRQALRSMTVTLPEGELTPEFLALLKDEVNVKVAVVEKGEMAVELDVTLTPELLREGIAREIIRHVNDLRKKSGLTIEDRIELFIDSQDGDVRLAVAEHEDALRSATLSSSVRIGGEPPATIETFAANTHEMVIGF